MRAGNGRAGFSESAQGGILMFMDRDDRGQERIHEVLAVKDRDAAFWETIDTHAHPALGRFHQLVDQKIRECRPAQEGLLHSCIWSKSLVRPGTSQRPLGYIQIDLTDHRATLVL